MRFSVITPSFNPSPWLALCIASVADQAVDVEHIVQDAGSTDGTLEWLRGDTRVQPFIEPDRGMYDGVNRGLRRAAGDILAYLNCDEQYLPGCLQTVEAFFRAHPAVDVLFGDFVVVNSDLDYLFHRKVQVPLKYHTWVSHLSVGTCATFFRRRILDRHGLFFDARLRVLDRDRAPFGLTISAAPHWGFVDETSGVRTGHYGTEIQVLADRELIRDGLVGAINVLFANDRARLLASDGIQHESLVGVGAALAAQVMPSVWLGGEMRYLRDYGGAVLNVFTGQALYIGPTFYTRPAENVFVSATWDFQVWGNATAIPGALDLANFERHQVKLRFGLEF